MKYKTAKQWEQRWRDANEFIRDIAELLNIPDADDLGFDGKALSIDDFEDAIKKYVKGNRQELPTNKEVKLKRPPLPLPPPPRTITSEG